MPYNNHCQLKKETHSITFKLINDGYVDNIKKKEDDPMSSLKDKTVTMAHGAGGRQTSELIDQIFAAHFANPDLTADDAAVLTPPAGKMAVSTDGFIVSPAF